MVSRKTDSHKSAKKPTRKWSAAVTKHSDALDLEKDVFKSGSAEECDKHAPHHVHCRICAEVRRICIDACEKALAA